MKKKMVFFLSALMVIALAVGCSTSEIAGPTDDGAISKTDRSVDYSHYISLSVNPGQTVTGYITASGTYGWGKIEGYAMAGEIFHINDSATLTVGPLTLSLPFAGFDLTEDVYLSDSDTFFAKNGRTYTVTLSNTSAGYYDGVTGQAYAMDIN